MRIAIALVTLLGLLMSGCTLPGADPDSDPDPNKHMDISIADEPEQDLFWEEPGAPPRGILELRWPGGEWAPSLARHDLVTLNATTVTDLPGPGQDLAFEARFVPTGPIHGTWTAFWTTWNTYTWQEQQSATNLTDGHRLTASPGTTEIRLEIQSPEGYRESVGFSRVVVTRAWEIHGVVQPRAAQAPGAPDVLQEFRVPTGDQHGTLLVSTTGTGDAPATGRDLRLSILLGQEEFCTDAPTPGVLDHTDHLLQAPLWNGFPVAQVFVGAPHGWCPDSYTGPVNLEPIEYVLRVQIVAPGAEGGFYIH